LRRQAETDKEDEGDGEKRRDARTMAGIMERGDKKAGADDRGYKVQPESVSR